MMTRVSSFATATPDTLLREARKALEGGRAAGALIEKALAQKLEVRHAEALFDLGNLLGEHDETATAITVFERALKIVPGHPGLLVNLAAQLDRANEQDRAEKCYRDVLERRPSEIAALANLAHLLFRQERFAEALGIYDRLVTAAPDAPAEIWNNRGVCQRWTRDPGAEASFRRALALAADSPQVLANLGFLLCEQRRFDEARPLLLDAHARDASRVQVAAQLLDLDLQFADWSNFERKRAEILAAVAKLASLPGQAVAPFPFLSICDDPALQLAAARSFAWPPPAAPPVNRRSLADNSTSTERLRIGFVSAAFQEHPETRLLIGLLERIDRNRFDVYAYALGGGGKSEMGARVASATTVFRDVERMTTYEIIAAVSADQIVILFDLTGHTSHARPELFAAKPAPVQVNFLGYSGTLGAAYYDYIVTDAYTTPGAEQVNFAERFWLIGECYLPCDTRRTLAETPPRQRYGLPANAFVFMSQAAPYKILPSMFEWWMRLVAEIDGSVLWLRPMPPLAVANLRAEAERFAVAPERLLFAPRESHPEYLARYRLADLYLDTYPFGSHTTVNDALFAGLPVLALAGRSMAARASASQVRAAGLPELVANSHEEYGSIALALARDRPRLAALTARLHGEGASAPLFDMQRYVREFEDGLMRIWREHVGPGAS
jgi:predicted O-linked N-acetylglucosamine transferase (SPINDLY family)